MKKVSFDFDGTLGHQKEIQEYCKQLLLNKDIEVHITTRRYGPENAKLCREDQPDCDWWRTQGTANWEEVFELADELGIERKNIHFCNMKDKLNFFIDNPEFILHLDDDHIELDIIKEYNLCDVVGIYVKYEDWKEQCNKLL